MIDTVWFIVRGAKVLPDYKIEFDPPAVGSDGVPVEAVKLFQLPDRPVSAKSASLRCAKVAKAEVKSCVNGRAEIWIQLHPTTWFDDDRWRPLERHEFREVIKDLQRRLLHEHGIEADLWKARITRLDATVDIVADMSFGMYLELLLHQCPKHRKWKFHLRNTGALYYCKRHALNIYGKFEQLEVDKQDTTTCPLMTMRWEYRARKSDQVWTSFKVRTIGDVCESYAPIADGMRTFLLKRVFARDVAPSSCSTCLADHLKRYKGRSGVSPVNCVLQDVGVSALVKCYGRNGVYEALASAAGNPQDRRRFRIRYEAAEASARAIGEISADSLYNELKTKVLAGIETAASRSRAQ
jgi:hypothetical protein